jgi:hypothetical protein
LRDDKEWLLDIIESIEKIEKYSSIGMIPLSRTNERKFGLSTIIGRLGNLSLQPKVILIDSRNAFSSQ